MRERVKQGPQPKEKKMPNPTNFWSSSEMNDPKRNSRWILLSNSIPVQTLTHEGRPEMTVGEVKHNYLSHEFKFPGNVTWNNISFTFVDTVDPDGAATIMDIIKYSGYHPLANKNDFATISKRGAIKALGNLQIMLVDSTGMPLETWVLKNAWVQSVKLSELSYESDTLADVTVTLVYDWAELQIASTSKSNFDKSKLQADVMQSFGGFNASPDVAEATFRGGSGTSNWD